LRWWDESQRADIIHYFGIPQPWYVRFAHDKGMRVIFSQLITTLAARSARSRAARRIVMATMRRTLPRGIMENFGWESYRLAEAAVALTTWEAELMVKMFGAP